jgi:lysophospholipase L1-like esterase
MLFSKINKKNIFPFIYFFLISVVFLYLIYRDFYLYNGQFTEFYIIYYILLLIAFIFSLITLLFSKKTNQNIFLSLVSIFLSFYIVQTIIYFYPIKKNVSLNNKKITIENTYDYSDMNFIGPDYFYNNLDSKYYPLSGIANLNTIYCNENGYWANYKSDRYGFNNPDEVWDYLEIDFALLGDSFTHGACVNYPDTFAGNISRKNYKVISLGTSGNGPIRQYASYREYLENKKVKNLLWIYYSGNDLDDLDKESKNNILKNYLINKNYKQNLIQNFFEIENLKIKFLNSVHKEKLIKKNSKKENSKKENSKKKNINQYSFLSFLKLSYLRESFLPNIPKKFFTIPDSNNLKMFEKILQRTKSIADQNNSKLYFIYLPSKNRYTGYNYVFLEKFLIKKILKKSNINFIDIHKDLFKKIDNPYLYYSSHLNEKGYEIVANKIMEKINYIGIRQ